MAAVVSEQIGSMRAVARIIRIIAGVVAALIVLGIILVVLEANPDNAIASFFLSVSEWLVTPFKALFTLKQQKIQVAVNWGIAAVVYLLVGVAIASLLARFGRRA